MYIHWEIWNIFSSRKFHQTSKMSYHVIILLGSHSHISALGVMCTFSGGSREVPCLCGYHTLPVQYPGRVTVSLFWLDSGTESQKIKNCAIYVPWVCKQAVVGVTMLLAGQHRASNLAPKSFAVKWWRLTITLLSMCLLCRFPFLV